MKSKTTADLDAWLERAKALVEERAKQQNEKECGFGCGCGEGEDDELGINHESYFHGELKALLDYGRSVELDAAWVVGTLTIEASRITMALEDYNG